MSEQPTPSRSTLPNYDWRLPSLAIYEARNAHPKAKRAIPCWRRRPTHKQEIAIQYTNDEFRYACDFDGSCDKWLAVNKTTYRE